MTGTWTEWFRLIRECRPAILFGEQVEAAVRWGWLDLVQADLESEGYACGAAVLPAAGVGAPHIRHRLWFVGKHTENKLAYPANIGCNRRGTGKTGDGRNAAWKQPERFCTAGTLAFTDFGRQQVELLYGDKGKTAVEIAGHGEDGRVGNALIEGLEGHAGDDIQDRKQEQAGFASETGHVLRGMADTERDGQDRPGTNQAIKGSGREESVLSVGGNPLVEEQPAGRPVNGYWRDADWLFCKDGKWRPVEPGLKPLASGIPNRVGRLRAYGNAIVPQVAAEFIRACM
ncbi:MAG: DNA cytosine methyltransferase [Oxalobacter formigenes]|nr:DNA cytosine methyltransferase [Oxalobacter formigenes]